MHTIQGPAVKIVKNHLGRTFAKVTQQLVVQMPMMGPGPVGPLPPGMPGVGPPGLLGPAAPPTGQP